MLSEKALEQAASDLEPAQRQWLRTYVSEAQFFNEVLSDDLDSLGTHDEVLEVGSGIGLLSLLAAARGLRVTSLEPQSAGFGEMRTMREAIMAAWQGPLPEVRWIDSTIESLPITSSFRYVFAINVVEHVPQPEAFMDEVLGRLDAAGRFRFICPNYHFPYEPHFNIPTLFSKQLTQKAFAKRIRSADLNDSQGLWDELSWPTTRRLRRHLTRSGWSNDFSGSATRAYIDRALSDPDFGERKGPLLRTAGSAISRLPRSAFDRIPAPLLPIIDCTVAGPESRSPSA